MQKVILITGASRGLGQALAHQLQDHHLVLVARSPFQGPKDALVIQADVGRQAEEIVQQALKRFGRIDILINNASTLGQTPLSGLESADWRNVAEVLHTNVLAPLHLSQLVLPTVETIVNVISDAGVQAYPGWGVYGMSKAALEHQTRTLAAEHPHLSIMAIDPGDMDTEMHRQAVPDADLQSLQKPEEVAARIIPRILGR